MATDYYELLGVSRSATADELKRAYRKRARELHPDANPDDAEAEAMFKELANAYSVLSDEDKRRRYDQFGPEGVNGGGADQHAGFGGIGDIFDAFFGGSSPFGSGQQRGPSGPLRGSDLEVAIDVDFLDAVFGSQQEVTVRTAIACEVCEATGASEGSAPATCPDCQGAGQVRRVRQTMLGQVVTAGACQRCAGDGQIISNPCPNCGGEGRVIDDRSYLVDIPAGVDTGSTVRVTGRGAVGKRGAGSGDLYVHMRVAEHDRFVRHGYDVYEELHLTVSQAALGAHVRYDTLDGEEDLVVPPATQTGKEFVLKGRGVPFVEGRGRGDLIVRILVDVPTDLTPDQEEALRRFAELRGDEVAPEDRGFFKKFRSAFR